MSFTKTFRVERVSFDSGGKESVLVEEPTSNILPPAKTTPCKVILHTDRPDEFEYTPMDAIFEISFKRVWPEEKA